MTRNEQSGFDPELYDADFFVWTQRQAAALRDLSRGAGLATVDIEHVAEEIEDMGKRDLREVSSLLSRLIEHLLKLDACPTSRDRAHWLSEAGHFQASAHAAFSPGMRRLLEPSKIWKRGRKQVTTYLRDVGSSVDIPSHPPFEIDELLSDDFDLLEALERLAARR